MITDSQVKQFLVGFPVTPHRHTQRMYTSSSSLSLFLFHLKTLLVNNNNDFAAFFKGFLACTRFPAISFMSRGAYMIKPGCKLSVPEISSKSI